MGNPWVHGPITFAGRPVEVRKITMRAKTAAGRIEMGHEARLALDGCEVRTTGANVTADDAVAALAESLNRFLSAMRGQESDNPTPAPE